MPAGASMSEPVFAMVLVVLAVASLLPLDEPGLAGAPSHTTEATACPGSTLTTEPSADSVTLAL